MKDNDYAFPGINKQGLTTRDYIAIAVLNGICSNAGLVGMNRDWDANARAATCYAMADAMMKARAQ